MRRVDGHAHAHELVLVDLVAAAFGHRLAEADDVDAGLQRVVARDQADVAAADDEQPLGRPHEVAVDERLERAGAVDARQRVAGEDQRLLAGACGDEQDVGPHDVVAVVAEDADAAVREDREDGAVQPDADVLEQAHVALEARGDVDAARAGIAGVDRTEELVRLEDELAAEPVLVVDQQHADAGPAELDGRRQAGRPAADDQALAVDGRNVAQVPGALDVREHRQAVERCTCMPGRTVTMHDFTGRPSATTVHWAHWPFAQKMPCGAPSLGWWPKMRTPLANSADAIVSPARPEQGVPFQKNSTVSRAGTGRTGCWWMRYSTTGVTPRDGRTRSRRKTRFGCGSVRPGKTGGRQPVGTDTEGAALCGYYQRSGFGIRDSGLGVRDSPSDTPRTRLVAGAPSRREPSGHPHPTAQAPSSSSLANSRAMNGAESCSALLTTATTSASCPTVTTIPVLHVFE